MTKHAVVIAGGGPTGLMLASELTLAGINVVIVERRASQEVESSRAGSLYARTIEVLDQRGVADRFLAEGQAMQVQGFAGIPLDISDFPARPPASSSPGGMRQQASWSPRSRCASSRRSAYAPREVASVPSTGRRAEGRTGSY